MKIFIDTNIFLDVILKREYYKEGLLILNNCSDKLFKGVISDITILNIDYIARKQIKDLRKFLKVINANFFVIGADNNMFSAALEIKNIDLEDNIQYCSAQDNDCEMIITNDRTFYEQDLKVISSSDFVKEFIIKK
jgi:predicted nucleic acid-binding protein